MKLSYNPPPVLKAFMRSDERVRIVRGPVGSGKSTAMVFELLRRAIQQQPDPEDGKRRSRMVIIRNTLKQIKSTCLVTVQNVLGPLVKLRVSDDMIQIRLGDIESDWLMLPLDTPENVQRLLSLEVTAAWVSECREIEPEIVMNVLSRCGRYPSQLHGGPNWYGLIAESNSFRKDSPWYELLENNLPGNWEYFVQPGAMEEDAENVENLPPSYYQDLLDSNTEEWAEMYVHNRYGESLDGQAVYKNSFNRKFHVAAKPLTPNPMMPLVIGMDFARWPAAVLGQVDPRGRLLVFAELESENTGVEKFAREYLLPLLHTPRFAGIPCYVVGDPSGVQRSQIGEESVFDALKKMGFHAYPAMTNNIDPRIRAVEKYLLQQRDGGAALLVDPGCKQLIDGFVSKYRFRKKKTGEFEDRPDKAARPWADLHDALQYLALGTAKAIYSKAMVRLDRSRAVSQQPISPGAWT